LWLWSRMCAHRTGPRSTSSTTLVLCMLWPTTPQITRRWDRRFCSSNIPRYCSRLSSSPCNHVCPYGMTLTSIFSLPDRIKLSPFVPLIAVDSCRSRRSWHGVTSAAIIMQHARVPCIIEKTPTPTLCCTLSSLFARNHSTYAPADFVRPRATPSLHRTRMAHSSVPIFFAKRSFETGQFIFHL